MHCHSLLCTLCNLEFSVKQDWNDHLMTSSHQQFAQEECQSSWFSNESIRSSCLILFSSCPLTPEFGKEIIQCFGNKFAGRFVTDFVWWRENPTFAVIEFESRFVAEKVLKENPNGDVVLSGKLVQIKSLNQILTLQWKQLIPFTSGPIERSPSTTPGFGRKQVEEFNWIRSCTEVSKDHWRSFCVMLSQLTKPFKCPGPFVLQNYPQRIQFHSSTFPLIFICASENGKFKALKGSQGSEILILHNRKKFLDRPPKQNKPVPGLCFILKGESQFSISFVTDFRYIREVQMARLLDYLCEFDSRLNGVLLLMAFWSKCHYIQLSHNNLPLSATQPRNGNPTILQWLVVLFLTIKGLIPSVKYMQDNLQSSAFFKNTCDNFAPAWVPGKFSEPEIALEREWKASICQPQKGTADWVESVVVLTQQMFDFYSKKFLTGEWVLDTHNGVILPETDAVEDHIVIIHPIITSRALGVFSKRHDSFKIKIASKRLSEAADRLQKWIANHEGIELWEVIGRGPDVTSKDKILDWQKCWDRIQELSKT